MPSYRIPGFVAPNHQGQGVYGQVSDGRQFTRVLPCDIDETDGNVCTGSGSGELNIGESERKGEEEERRGGDEGAAVVV